MVTRSIDETVKPNSKYFSLTQVRKNEPNNVSEALKDVEWKHAMEDEVDALKS